MGFFDIFGKGGALKKHAGRTADRRAQAPDRWESIQALAKMKTPESAEALLRRFGFRIDPSITDQEEKDAAFEGIVATGPAAVAPTRAFLRTTQAVSWPIKILERLLSAEEVVSEILALLEPMDTEYARDPERKIELIAYLVDRRDARIGAGVVRFNETARFQAAAALLSQPDAEAHRDALLDRIEKDDSVRVRVRILDGLRELGWSIPEARRDTLRVRLPQGWALDAAGVPRR
jgi:hypothetical protein